MKKLFTIMLAMVMLFAITVFIVGCGNDEPVVEIPVATPTPTAEVVETNNENLVEVPDLIGMSLEEAKVVLNNVGLSLFIGEGPPGVDMEDFLKWFIHETNPPHGTQVERYTYIIPTSTSPTATIELGIDLTGQGITDEQLAEMIANGEIPANVTWLDLSSNEISDISPLAGLTNLTRLTLRFNEISDITPLVWLTNLTLIALSRNEISDISPLANLTNLETLDLWGNDISDLTPLAGLTNLERLSLERNEISNITPLAGLTNITWLELQSNEISDITPLVGLTNLTSLDLGSNLISDWSPVDHVENVRGKDSQRREMAEGGEPLPDNLTADDLRELLVGEWGLDGDDGRVWFVFRENGTGAYLGNELTWDINDNFDELLLEPNSIRKSFEFIDSNTVDIGGLVFNRLS